MNIHKFKLLAVLLSITTLSIYAQKKYTISGYVKDKKNGEDLIGATIYAKEAKSATTTNAYGYYSITLPEGTYTLQFLYIGFGQVDQNIELSKDQTIDISLAESSITTEEVVITEKRADSHVADMKMSKIEMNVAQLKKLPPLFGEPDLIKLVQLQPGVISAGEGSSAFFVRGGSADQNLILYDEAPIYDPSHLFGLFSAFNTSIVKSSELYKGGIPANFGGRLSSVLDVRSIDGNAKRAAGSFSLGLLAARASIQGPIGKQLFKKRLRDSLGNYIEGGESAKASFMLAARRSFIGYAFQINPATRNNDVYFYDINGKINWNIGDKDRVFFSFYSGRDLLSFGNAFKFEWGNNTSTLRWNHIFNKKLFLNTTAVFSLYDYGLGITNIFTWKAGITEYTIKQDYTYYLSPKNTLSFGFNTALREFIPGNFKGEIPAIPNINLDRLKALDNAIYVSDKIDVTPQLSLEGGVRLSIFTNLGAPTTYYTYKNPGVFGDIQKTDSTKYGDMQAVATYINPEPRFSARYMLNESSSLKLSYNRMSQNVHQIITGIVPLPTSFWLPSSPYLKPQIADQIAVGYFKNFRDNMFEFSVEGYYKNSQNAVDFADNTNALLNKDLPQYIRQGKAWSYGFELFLVKTKGKFTGQVSYTLSWAKRNIAGVNNGEEYFSTYDRRHSINLIGTYDFNDRWSVGGTWTYGSGRPITFGTNTYNIGGTPVSYISERNGYRLADYHRLDLSVTLKSKKKPNRWWSSETNFSIYNVYWMKNPFSITVGDKTDDNTKNLDGTIAPGTVLQNAQNQGREVVLTYLFPVLPSISYTFNF